MKRCARAPRALRTTSRSCCDRATPRTPGLWAGRAATAPGRHPARAPGTRTGSSPLLRADGMRVTPGPGSSQPRTPQTPGASPLPQSAPSPLLTGPDRGPQTGGPRAGRFFVLLPEPGSSHLSGEVPKRTRRVGCPPSAVCRHCHPWPLPSSRKPFPAWWASGPAGRQAGRRFPAPRQGASGLRSGSSHPGSRLRNLGTSPSPS